MKKPTKKPVIIKKSAKKPISNKAFEALIKLWVDQASFQRVFIGEWDIEQLDKKTPFLFDAVMPSKSKLAKTIKESPSFRKLMEKAAGQMAASLLSDMTCARDRLKDIAAQNEAKNRLLKTLTKDQIKDLGLMSIFVAPFGDL